MGSADGSTYFTAASISATARRSYRSRRSPWPRLGSSTRYQVRSINCPLTADDAVSNVRCGVLGPVFNLSPAPRSICAPACRCLYQQDRQPKLRTVYCRPT